ncbi:RNA-binding protein pop5 [Lecanora helva]
MVRIKHRYLLVHILYPNPDDAKSKASTLTPNKSLPDLVQFHAPSPDDLNPGALINAIKNQIQDLYGDYGVGLVSSSLVVKYLSPATSTAIIRCSRNHYRLAWAALSFMTHLPSTPSQKQSRPCVMRVVRVSGTIKKAEEEAIRQAREAILKARREGGDNEKDRLMELLGKEEEQVLSEVGGKIDAGSNIDEDDEMAMNSDEDG